MKYWKIIRAFRFLCSPRWKHMNVALDHVRIAINQALKAKDQTDVDAYLRVAESWLHDAEYEWEHLKKIRDGKE